MQTIYLLSGLGADHRAFRKLNLKGYNLVFIEWISPLNNESISGYAKRLLIQIKEEKPVLIGLSFGGMVALEIAKMRKPELLFLISSARNHMDFNPKFRALMKSDILKLIPGSLFKKSNFMLEYLMGIQQTENKNIFAEIVADTDTSFLFWALNAMTKWENDVLPENMVEIHGTADRLIPFRQTAHMNAIKNGGHLMVLDKADSISSIVLSYLSGNSE